MTDAPPSAAPPSAAPPDDIDRRTWHVVLAEDRPSDRDAARDALLRGSDRQYAFVTCETAAEAIAAVEAGGVDLLLLDYQLPDAEAPDVLARLLRAPDSLILPVVPVVVMADARPEGAARNRAVLRAGAQDFVGKDWLTPTSLTRAAEAAVERHRMAVAYEARGRALARSEERLRMTLDGAGIGWWERDTATGVTVCDERAAELWGGTPADFRTSEDFLSRIHPDDAERAQTAIAEATAAGQPYEVDFRVVRPGKAVRWIMVRGRRMPDVGTAGMAHGVNIDVTERREQEETIRQANAEMERFTYTVSHDLKSPLVTVAGFLGLLKTYLAGGQVDRAAGAADRAISAAGRMSRIIDDLLVLSRAGRTVGTAAPVSLDALAATLAADLGVRADDAGGRIDVQGPLGIVLADETRIGEALENLLANGVRHGVGGGGTRVVVRSEQRRGGALRLIVEDDGPGVPEAYRERVFDLFQRLDAGSSGNTASGPGTGVGLAVVARVMEVLGGRAHVESAGGADGNEGARFVLEFPDHAVVVP